MVEIEVDRSSLSLYVPLQLYQVQTSQRIKAVPGKSCGGGAGRLSSDVHKSVPRSKTKRTSAATRQSSEAATSPPSHGSGGVTGGGEPVVEQRDEASDHSECEIVDIVCREMREGGSDSESDLSAAAEEIVNEVLGTPHAEGGEGREEVVGCGGGEGRKAAKSVRFSESPPRGGSSGPPLEPVQREPQEKVCAIVGGGGCGT